MIAIFLILQLASTPSTGWFPPVVYSEGLSVVLDVTCDSTGFIRTTTQDGFHRFDGREWVTTKRTATDSLSFSDNWINKILEWRKREFFLATESGGLNMYNENTREKRAFIPDSASGLTSGTFRDLTLLPNGKILVATWGQGLFTFDPGSKTYSKVVAEGKSQLSDPFIRQLSPAPDGTWIGTRSGLNFLTHSGSILAWFPSELIPEKDVDFIVCTEPDSTNGVWFGTRNGVYYLNKETNQIHAVGPQAWKPVVTTLFRDKTGNLWVGTYNEGVTILNPEGIVLTRLSAENGMLPGNYVRRITMDRDGNAWIGTWGFGLAFLRRNPQVFSVLPGTEDLPVRAILEGETSQIFTGTWGNGLVLTNEKGIKKSRQLNDVTSMTSDEKGNYWVGGSQGLMEIPAGGTELKWWRGRSGQELLPGAVRKLWYQPSGILWILTNGGILTENRNTNALRLFSDTGKLPDKNTEFMVPETDTSAWFAFRNNGIARISWRIDSTDLPVVSQVSTYRSDPTNLQTLSGNSILHLFVDLKRRLWVATATGLNLFRPNSGSFKRFGIRDGFPNEVIYAITQDNEGWFWVSSNAGLTRFQLTDQETIASIRTWNHNDGLAADEFNTAAVVNFSDGRLGFGSIRGLITFHPDNLKTDPTSPPLGISGISIGINPVTFQPGHVLEMNYLDQIVEVRYAVLRYDNVNRHRFSWNLEGFDGGWSVPQPDGKIVYTNLDPGNYTLKMRGADAGGIWSETSLDIPLRVIPPFYMTWWFRGGFLLLLLGIPSLYVYYRFEKLKAVEQLRVKIARDLHDEVGSQLTRVNIQANLLASQIHPEQRDKQARTLIDESQSVIRTMSDVVWSIDADNDSAGECFNRIRSFAESLCDQTGIQLRFHATGFDPDHQMDIQFRQDLYLIAKEAINNAIKYSGATMLSVRFEKKGSEWVLEVADNGKGLPENPSKGNGLKNIRSRAKTLGAAAEWISAGGTTVRVTGTKFT